MKDHQQNKGRVFLIPTPIAEKTQNRVLPREVFQTCSSLDLYLAENVRSARRFISSLDLDVSINKIEIEKIPADLDSDLIQRVLGLVESGRDLGIVSEAGCPSVADPGSSIVAEAHKRAIKIVPLVGPSSILLALMGSGLNGQSFRFHGYLPIQKEPLFSILKGLERELAKTGTTQIFMETPYRNRSIFDSILKVCRPEVLLCVAKDLTGVNMFIRTLAVGKWQKRQMEWPKQPTIFLIGRSEY